MEDLGATRTRQLPTAIPSADRKMIRFRIFITLMILAVAAVEIRGQFGDKLSALYYEKVRDPRIIRQYLETHSVRKLQLGAGSNNPEGWLNSDIKPEGSQIYVDATSPYPFPSGSFQYILAEHLIEHVPWESGLKMLKECFRILAPGGKIRIVTPDLAKYFYVLNNGNDPEIQRFIKANRNVFEWPETPVGPAYVFNKEMREWGHQFLYNAETLRRTLELAGFSAIRQLQIGERTDPVFENAELRTSGQPSDFWLINKIGAMAFEATK
jgi:predicted SAM-dependent methyltransferase